MSKGLEALSSIKIFTKNNDSWISEHLQDEYQCVEQELNKIQELYSKIQEKRDNARLIRVEYARKQDVSDIEKTEICAEIITYNDILLLMRSMFDVD